MTHSTYVQNPALVWHDLSHAARFERDGGKVGERIPAAEKAILARIKELFVATTEHSEEDQVLEDALHALRALRNCVTPAQRSIIRPLR